MKAISCLQSGFRKFADTYCLWNPNDPFYVVIYPLAAFCLGVTLTAVWQIGAALVRLVA